MEEKKRKRTYSDRRSERIIIVHLLQSHVNNAIQLKENKDAAMRNPIAGNCIIPDQTAKSLEISNSVLTVLLLKSLLNNRHN